MPKFIKGPVGRSTLHASIDDVVTVQYLLNCVPENRGGPQQELRVDGLLAADTIQAIARFQKAAQLPVDGRVEPSGATLARLQQFDPFPEGLLPQGRVAQYNPKELTVDK